MPQPDDIPIPRELAARLLKDRMPDAQPDDFYGVFRDGYTDDTMASVGPKFLKMTGFDLVAVFDHADEWGPGGDSEIYMRAKDGKIAGVPDAVRAFLRGETWLRGRTWASLEADAAAPVDARSPYGSEGMIIINDHCWAIPD